MNVTLRIPTQDQYAFVEVVFEDKKVSPETVKEEYDKYIQAFKVNGGLPPKEWNAALDRYLNDATGETATYLAMSPEQQRVIQEIKRAFKRLDAKEIKNNRHQHES